MASLPYIYRLSVPYTPPTLKYMSLDDVVRRFEDFSYQLYLADERSTSEISDNVCALSLPYGQADFWPFRWRYFSVWFLAGRFPTSERRVSCKVTCGMKRYWIPNLPVFSRMRYSGVAQVLAYRLIWSYAGASLLCFAIQDGNARASILLPDL